MPFAFVYTQFTCLIHQILGVNFENASIGIGGMLRSGANNSVPYYYHP